MFLYTDGGARGNPGPSSGAAVLYNDKNELVFEKSEYYGIGTNNQAEYKALLLGINECLKTGVTRVECFLDSELVVKQLNGFYKVKEPSLSLLFAEIKALLSKFDSVAFTHIPRSKNKIADGLVNKILDTRS